MMRTRVLQVLPALAEGGAERVAVSLACGLDRRKFEPALLSLFPAPADALAETLSAAGVPLISLHKRPGFDARMYRGITRVLKLFRPHVVHTHLPVLHYTFLPALYERVPAQVHTVHSLAHKDSEGLHRWTQRVAFRCGVLPVAVAREVAASIRCLYHIDSEVLVPNGISTERYRKPDTDRETWRSNERLAPDGMLFLSVASLRPPKGHHVLLEAFAILRQSAPEARLLLAGDGDLRQELGCHAAALGLGGHVRFLGERHDIPELLAAADVFVLASLWEGNPLALMEAMAAGKPVIATEVGGVPELVEHGAEGVLVQPGDARKLAEAMRCLYRHPELRGAMGAAAARRAAQNFDLAAMVRRYEALYEELLAQSNQVRWPAGGWRAAEDRSVIVELQKYLSLSPRKASALPGSNHANTPH